MQRERDYITVENRENSRTFGCSKRSTSGYGSHMPEKIRLQKVLADRGVASRRGSAEIIAAGRVAVNGAVVDEPGLRVDPAVDGIRVDGVELPADGESTRTIMLYKPRGYICSRSDKQGKTVFDLLEGIPERIVPAGRLDKDSEGLLLLSNDGGLIEKLTHPRFGQEKEYRVTVSGSLAPEVIKELASPIDIEGYTTVPARVSVLRRGDSRTDEQPGKQPNDEQPNSRTTKEGKGKPDVRSVLVFVLGEGRNRQVRRLCERSGLRVHRLVRTRVGDLLLKGLKPGQWRDIR
jgi:23S rRNA pseudouridine2605 synthase